MNVRLEAVTIVIPEGANVVVGQAHFIKTVEDLSEILVGSVPGISFGLAFSEASGPCLIRTNGNDDELIATAVDAAKAVAAGHSFYLFIRNAFPINVLNQIKQCPEVATLFAATSNPLQLLCAGTAQGRGIIGAIDGASPAGVEDEEEKRRRHDFLRKIGYKY